MRIFYHLLVVLCVIVITTFGRVNQCEAQASFGAALPSPEEAKKMNERTVGIIFHYEELYHQLTDDMKSILDKENKIRLVQIIGSNHVQSIYDMLHLKGVDLSIVHSDVLEFLFQMQSYRTDKRINYLVKLFNEKVAVIANSSYKRIEDLRGRLVNFDKVGKGRHITATLLFNTLGIKVQPLFLNKKVALEKVKSGDIDAMVYLVEDIELEPEFQGLTKKDNVTLLPIPQTDSLLKIYDSIDLTNQDFPNLLPEGTTLPSLTVGVMLASYNWKPGNWQYRKIKRFVNEFVSKFDKFKDPAYHRAWKKVSLVDETPGWSRSPVMVEAVKGKYASMSAEQVKQGSEDSRDLNKVKARLDSELARSENPEALLEEFLDYMRVRRGDAETVTRPSTGAEPGIDRLSGAPGRSQYGTSTSQTKEVLARTLIPEGKIVFVTSTMIAPDLGGLAVADATCNDLAQAARLPGSYVAWLSTSSINARERLDKEAGPIVRVDGVKIAENTQDLLDGDITNPINITEKGAPFEPMVWTGTDASGMGVSGFSCADWHKNSHDVKAIFGKAGRMDQGWTDMGTRNINCSINPNSNITIGIYCFQR